MFLSVAFAGYIKKITLKIISLFASMAGLNSNCQENTLLFINSHITMPLAIEDQAAL